MDTSDLLTAGRSRLMEHALVITLGLLTAFGSISIDMYLPAFPQLAADLHVPESQIQLSVTVFLAGIAAGQLLVGPLSDHIGRKIPLYTGLIIYIIAAIACTLVSSFGLFILLRLLQGLGGSAGQVISRSLVNDLYPPGKTAQIFTTLQIIMGISPIAAPLAGGLIADTFNWQLIFIMMAFISGIALVCSWLLIPGPLRTRKPAAFTGAGVARVYHSLIVHPKFLSFAMLRGINNSGAFAFVSGSPFVLMSIYELSGKQFGWIFSLSSVGVIAAGMLNKKLLLRFSAESILKTAVSIQAFSGLLLVSAVALHAGILLFMVPAFVFIAALGCILPNATALYLEAFPGQRGAASALLGSASYFMAVCVTAAVSASDNGTAYPMVVTMLFCALLSFLLTKFSAPQKKDPLQYDDNK